MIEQPLAIGKAPAQRLQFLGRHRQERERELHDVVEWQGNVDAAAAAFAPLSQRPPRHCILITPSTPRHSVGRTRWSCAICTEWSDASIPPPHCSRKTNPPGKT